jgi:hypothetical protein
MQIMEKRSEENSELVALIPGIKGLVEKWCKSPRISDRPLIEQVLGMANEALVSGHVAAEELELVMKREIRTQLRAEVLEWYHDSPTYQPIRDHMGLLAGRAVLDGHMGLHELYDMVSSEEACMVLSQRIDSLINEIFDNVPERDDAVALTADDRGALTTQITEWVAKVKQGETVASFMRELVVKKCGADTDTPVDREELREHVKQVGLNLFVDGLIVAARNGVKACYHEHLVDADMPEVLRRHIRYSLDEVMEQNDEVGAISSKAALAVREVASNLLESSLDVRRVGKVLDEVVKASPKYAVASEALKDALVVVSEEMRREETLEAERALSIGDPEWLLLAHERVSSRREERRWRISMSRLVLLLPCRSNCRSEVFEALDGI